jgi:hydroxycarboxylate dehydrogenase B
MVMSARPAILKPFTARHRGAILPFGAPKGSGLSVISEILAGSLTGGGASAAGADRSARLVNKMKSIMIDPTRLTTMEDFTTDVEDLVTCVTGSPPMEKGGRIYLPGDIERETHASRIANGVPLPTP